MTSPRPRVGDQIETAEQLDALRAELAEWVAGKRSWADQHHGRDDWLEATARADEAHIRCLMARIAAAEMLLASAQPRTPEPAPATVEQATQVIHARIVDAAAFGQIDIEVHDLRPIDFERSIAQALATAGLLRTPVTAEQIERAAAELRSQVNVCGDDRGCQCESAVEDSRHIVRTVLTAAGVPVEGSQGDE